MLPSFLARLECGVDGASDFLFTAIDVAVVVAADVVVAEAGFVAVMGFIVAETGFTEAISTFSGVFSEPLTTNQKRNGKQYRGRLLTCTRYRATQ